MPTVPANKTFFLRGFFNHHHPLNIPFCKAVLWMGLCGIGGHFPLRFQGLVYLRFCFANPSDLGDPHCFVYTKERFDPTKSELRAVVHMGNLFKHNQVFQSP